MRWKERFRWQGIPSLNEYAPAAASPSPLPLSHAESLLAIEAFRTIQQVNQLELALEEDLRQLHVSFTHDLTQIVEQHPHVTLVSPIEVNPWYDNRQDQHCHMPVTLRVSSDCQHDNFSLLYDHLNEYIRTRGFQILSSTTTEEAGTATTKTRTIELIIIRSYFS